VLLLFWQGILSKNSVLNGWTIESIRTYYLFLIAGQALLIHHVELTVGFLDIKQGELVRELLKPTSYMRTRFIAETPWRLLQGFYAFVSMIPIVYFLDVSVHISTNTAVILLAILTALNAFIISFLFKMVLGFTAFWLTNIDSLLEANDVLMFSLSGILLPLNLLPSWMQTLAQFTPYPYMLYYPISAFIGIYNTTELIQIIFAQFGIMAVLLLIYKLMWHQGLKKFSGVGQ